MMRNKHEARREIGYPFDAASKATWAAIAYHLARRTCGDDSHEGALRELRAESAALDNQGIITRRQGVTFGDAVNRELVEGRS